MKFIDLVQRRSSVRAYSDQQVEQEKLDYIIEAARLAPSAANFQPWRIITIQSEEGKDKLYRCYERSWFKSAPLYLVLCGDHSQSWKRNFDNKDHADIDIAIATEHICLAATEQGLGTCWVCHFDTKRCAELLNIPEHIEPIALIPIGYPADSNKPENGLKLRKSIEDIVVKEHF